MLNIQATRRASSEKLFKILSSAREDKTFFLIAGTNVIQDKSSLLQLARKIDVIAKGLGLPWLFKASWDKANRTSHDGYRG